MIFDRCDPFWSPTRQLDTKKGYLPTSVCLHYITVVVDCNTTLPCHLLSKCKNRQGKVHYHPTCLTDTPMRKSRTRNQSNLGSSCRRTATPADLFVHSNTRHTKLGDGIAAFFFLATLFQNRAYHVPCTGNTGLETAVPVT